MVDNRFSADEFLQAGHNSKAARALADELAQTIQEELHHAILPAIEQVVAHLNEMGHSLSFYDQPVPGEIAYRDDTETGAGYECRLRVAVDTIISTGYGHVINEPGFDDTNTES